MSETLFRSDVQEKLLLALEKASHLNVYACYQCGKCTAACPFSFSPQRVMSLAPLRRVLRPGSPKRSTPSTHPSITPWILSSTSNATYSAPLVARTTMRRASPRSWRNDHPCSKDNDD